MRRACLVNELSPDDSPWIIGLIHSDTLHIHRLVVEEFSPLLPAVAVSSGPGLIVVAILGINIRLAGHMLRSPPVLPVLAAGFGSPCPLDNHIGLLNVLRPRGIEAAGNTHCIYLVPAANGVCIQSDPYHAAGYCNSAVPDTEHPCGVSRKSSSTFPDQVPAS